MKLGVHPFNCIFVSLIFVCLTNYYSVRAQTHKWQGGNSQNWDDPANWSTNTVPNISTAKVILDNTHTPGSYTVTFSSNASTSVESIEIVPASGNTITLILLSATSSALIADTLVINSGGVFKNASSSASGLTLVINTLLSIRNGGKYIHNTKAGHARIIDKLSDAAGTETGIVEFINPDAGTTFSLSGRTYGTLILNQSSGTCTYTANGANNIVIKGNLEIKPNVVLNTVGFTAGTCSIKGNLINLGAWNTSLNQKIEFNGTSSQFISGNAPTFAGVVEINNPVHVVLNTSAIVDGRLTFTKGLLRTATNVLILGTNATLTGEASDKYVVGNLQTTRTVGTASSNFGGIGVTMDAGAENIGTVTIIRKSGPEAIINFNGNTSIARNWNINVPDMQPTVGRNLTFTWVSADDNMKDLTTAQVWKQTASNQPWEKVGMQQNVMVTNPRSITVNATSFSTWTVSDANNPLPVNLVSFDGKYVNGYAHLTWVTAFELNNAGFVVERSDDAIEFEEVESVQVSENPKKIKTYIFKDNSISQSSYYRLKQVDIDGRYDYSKLIHIQIPYENLFRLSVSPNPTDGHVNIDFPSQKEVFLQLSTLQGHQLLEVTKLPMYALEELNNILEKLHIGVYIIKVVQEGKQYQEKIIKW